MARTTVEGLLAALDPVRREQVEAVRSILLDAVPRLVEGVRWNAPSYSADGEDRITFNLADRAGRVRLVLHMGVARAETRGAPPVIEDAAGLVAWSSDIRGLVTFDDLADVEAKRTALADVVRRWIAVPV